jgi:hypothetical protein
MQRLADIRRLEPSFVLKLIWECDWKEQLRKNTRLARAYRELALPSAPLNLRRDAYFGGRVEAFRMLHECDTGQGTADPEEIIAIDVVSSTRWDWSHH